MSHAQRRAFAIAAAIVGLSATGLGPAGAAGKPRVFHLDSYRAGYGISDETDQGLRAALGDKAELTTFYLDSKRHADEEEIKKSAARAKAAIEEWKPDVLVASDDPAVKYVVVPNYKAGPFPVVFCGVNWSAEPYGLPTPNVTGMIEVVPILEAIDLLKRYYPAIHKLGVLSEESLSEQQNRVQLEPKYKALGVAVTYLTVPDYAAWKREYERLQDAVDLVYLPTQGAVRQWDGADARAFVHEKTKKPSVTTDAFMMPYALLGLTKTAVEQGEWAGQAALAIARGKKAGDIPVVRNRRRIVYLNRTLAARLKFVPGPELEGAKTVD